MKFGRGAGAELSARVKCAYAVSDTLDLGRRKCHAAQSLTVCLQFSQSFRITRDRIGVLDVHTPTGRQVLQRVLVTNVTAHSIWDLMDINAFVISFGKTISDASLFRIAPGRHDFQGSSSFFLLLVHVQKYKVSWVIRN